MIKKVSFFVVCVLFLAVGCNKSNRHNPFAGTRWSAPMSSYFKDLYVISFSDADYNYYMADENGVFSHYLDKGTYTFEDNNLSAQSSGEYVSSEQYDVSYVVLGATLSVDLLTVRLKVIQVGVPIPEHEIEKTFTKL